MFVFFCHKASAFHLSNVRCFALLGQNVLAGYKVCSSGSVMIPSGAFSKPRFQRQGSTSSNTSAAQMQYLSSSYPHESSHYPPTAIYGHSPTMALSTSYPSQSSNSYPRSHSHTRRPSESYSHISPHAHHVYHHQHYEYASQQAMYSNGAVYPSPLNYAGNGW